MSIEKQTKLEIKSRSVIGKVSPLVSKIAERMNIDLTSLSGTGSEGQINLNDLRIQSSPKKSFADTENKKAYDSTKMATPKQDPSKNSSDTSLKSKCTS